MGGKRGTPEERLLRRRQVDSAGCWIWTGALNRAGYGMICVDGLMRRCHRLAWALYRGPIPDGLQLDHLCRVRSCFNPDHLEPVDAWTNALRGCRSQKTHCPYGHPYDAINTRWKKPRGKQKTQRDCRECERRRNREYKRRVRDRQGR